MNKQEMYCVGDIVKLKSGGPDMTIRGVLDNPLSKEPTVNYKCQWFAGKKLDNGIFPQESLVKVENES
jgi:uncharacterized protein YodC (DUF2158 family)